MESKTESPDIARSVQHYSSNLRGFAAIDDVLAERLKRSLTNAAREKKPGVGPWYSFADAKLELGIYTISRRVKSKRRLQEKLERMQEKGEPTDPYFRFVHDIVGNRVVCLHPDDLFDVAKAIQGCMDGRFFCQPERNYAPCVVRRGQFSATDLTEFQKNGFRIDEPHKAGYTSIHFVFGIGPEFREHIPDDTFDALKNLQESGVVIEDCLVEIQLRTILEDAWSEIDHVLRYEDAHLANDPELLGHARAMAAYTQACNNHISVIRECAARKRLSRRTP